MTTNLMLIAIGAGCFFLSVRWLVLFLAATVAGWAVMVTRAPPSHDWVHFGCALFSATGLSVILHAIRLRTYRRLEGLRLQDEARKAELESALEKERLYRELQTADQRKDQFLAMLAHELRNPLGAMSNAAQLLKRFGPDEPRLRRALDTIERQVGHQTRLLDDLLDVSRITRGKIELRRARLDLAALIRATAEDRRPDIETAGLVLTLDLPPDPVWVNGDPVRLTQVVANLLHNAAKFTDPGGHVTVRLTAQGGKAARGSGLRVPTKAGPSLPHP